ncbi:DUF3899 domain-containing protein [Bacillus sp. FJAT-27445]|uniref:DUF3899 domain-containing protein n=1 Tax=Bacillus sp. FJAT-27445 TaxID=1679166 RepID=UPI000744368B|nr:DUF3899 domain-containing protein [Bacillus sp. FJAT-27445]
MARKSTVFLLLIMAWLIAKPILSLSWLEIINRSFLAGIIFLLASAIFLILKTGFLGLFLDGFHKLGSFITPKSRAMEREDERAREDESLAEFKGSLLSKLSTYTSLIGLSSISASLLGLLIYY